MNLTKKIKNVSFGPTFRTENLNVFAHACYRGRHLGWGVTYVAYHRYDDWQGPVVIATVFDFVFAPVVEWIETNERYRRMGMATELWHGMEKHLGVKLHGTPGSRGAQLCSQRSGVSMRWIEMRRRNGPCLKRCG
jgi:hypothetical protein